MKPFIVFFTLFGISMAAPQGFGLVGFKFKFQMKKPVGNTDLPAKRLPPNLYAIGVMHVV